MYENLSPRPSIPWIVGIKEGGRSMIFIYVVLVSVSIIYGLRSKNKVMGQQVYLCSSCQRQSYHTIVRSRRWFTLYFIPIIPMRKSTTSRCNLCGYQELISNEQADAWFTQAQSGAAPQAPQQLMEEGLTLTRAGHYMEAIAVYDQVIQHTPNNHEAYYYKGEALYGLGRYQEAILAYDRAIQIAPQVPHAYYSKGKALERLGRTAEAQ
jgi:Flp pilus assembly protein TadD